MASNDSDKGSHVAGKSEAMRRSKREYIEVVMYSYGMTRKEALQYIRNATPEALEALIDGYENECRKAFYND